MAGECGGILQDQALLLAAAALLSEKSCTGRVLENLAHTLVGLSGTLEVLVGRDLLADFLSLLNT